MSFPLLILALAGGGLVVGALCGALMSQERSGGMLRAIVLGVGVTVIAGVLLTTVFETENTEGLVWALLVGPVALYGGMGSHGHGDSGSCDSGGDGGGGCD